VYERRMMAALVFMILVVGGAASGEQPRISAITDVDTADRVTAPVVYRDLMLVLASDQGVAAIVFTDKLKEGRAYKFRYESKDGKTKKTGTGKVFEKYKRVATRKWNEFHVVDIGGHLYLKAGPIKLEWSYGDEERGWVYYNPDKVRVQIASADEFDRLALKRFAK
jgi:hypothetical protein